MEEIIPDWKNNRENMRPMLALSILTLILIIFEIMVLKNLIPEGYNVTIYDQTDSLFWYIQILIYFLGVCLALQRGSTLIRRTGILVLLTNYFIFLITPYFLQYYSMNGRDTLTNLGQLRELINGSHLGSDNIYPATHIVLGSVAIISGIQPNIIALLLPIVFSFIFIIGEYSFSRLLISETNARYLLIPTLTIFYFRGYHFIMSPQYTYMMVLPIGLFALYKHLFSQKNRVSFSVVFTVLLISIPFEHPFIFIFISYILLTLVALEWFSIVPKIKAYKELTLINVIFFLWLTNNYILLKGSADTMKFFTGDTQFTATQAQGAIALQSGFHKVSFAALLNFLFLTYGRYIIPILFIFLVSLALFKNKGHKEYLVGSYYCILALFIIFGIMDLNMLVNPLVAHVFERVTTLNFFIYALIPLFALSLYFALLRNKKQKCILMVAVLLTILFSLSLFGAHESPSTFEPNDAVTYNEVLGMSWIMENRDASYPILDLANNQEEVRFHDLFFGPSHRPPELTYSSMINHFGYNDKNYNNNLNSSLKYKYITITEYDEFLDIIYSKYKIPEQPPYFSSEDFKRFRADHEINKIFDSLNIQIYKT